MPPKTRGSSKQAKGKAVATASYAPPPPTTPSKHTKPRPLIYEREFPYDSSIPFCVSIRQYGFTKMVEKRGEGSINIVREFWENAHRTGRRTEPGAVESTVQGYIFEIIPSVIREFYSLQTVSNCQYHRYLGDAINFPYQEIAETLTLSPRHAQWHISSGVQQHIKRGNLNRQAKIWLHFVSTNILPTSHRSDVNRKQALLIYCLMHNKPVAVSTIIADYFQQVLVDQHLVLGFPHLIFDICKAAGIQQQPGDVPFPTQKPFNYRFIKEDPVAEEGPHDEMEEALEAGQRIEPPPAPVAPHTIDDVYLLLQQVQHDQAWLRTSVGYLAQFHNVELPPYVPFGFQSERPDAQDDIASEADDDGDADVTQEAGGEPAVGGDDDAPDEPRD